MRFLIIAGSPWSLVHFRGHLIEALLKSGIEVHAAAPDLSAESQVRDRLEAMGARVHDIYLKRTGTNPLDDARTLWALLRLIRRVGPHYVLGYTIKPVIFGSLAATWTRRPRRYALITGLGYSFSDEQGDRQQRWVRRIAVALYKLSLRYSHKVFFQNPDDQALFRSHGILGSTTPSVVVNGSGVDTDYFAPQPYPPVPDFLLIARLLADKGVRQFAEAAYRLKADFPEATFTLVGDLDANPNSITREELDRWVEDGVIRYLGHQSDVRAAFASSSVFVLPTFYREGVPRTILEALSMGRPIITTDTPGCRETVIEGENGYLVPARDVDELSQAMRSFLERPELVALMGQRSRELALQKYDVHKVNAVMLKEMGVP
ncbi:glycosyltransferase family 4 protein [Halomonas cerina]|uniref:Glycosyltransferase involved in cell wall biosynthesis n=1 Tax=Halomonas cerina TaxID=447424 RepID=A0A839V7A6_9GAMM|nr:glycosyltransferase family 4 protein [Halomonas cerina]MBB3189409.1 glycosyltransferase involved in cell wall biosynthesis [Halomonas cerina]